MCVLIDIGVACVDVFMILFFCTQETAYLMLSSDWSSDVCSSDLDGPPRDTLPAPETRHEAPASLFLERGRHRRPRTRSEERRVGKECVRTSRSRWSAYQ